jgi:DHA1 family multidrug resistance protein-like MFS transporter
VNQSIRRLLPILALTVFCSNLGNGIIAPLLPGYAETLGANGFWLGVIFAGTSIASAILMPFTGRFSDKHGRKGILAFGLLGLCLTSFAYIWAQSIASLLAVRLVQGAASAMVGPISQAYIGDITPRGQEGKWMGIFNATFVIGFGSGPLLGGVVADHLGINAAFSIMGFLNLASFLSVLVFLPEILERKKSAGQFSIRDITASGITKGIFVFQLGSSAARGIMTTFIPVFAAAVAGLSTAYIGTLLTITIVINSLLQIPTGALADRFNRKFLIALGLLGLVVHMTLLPLADGFWLLVLLLVMGAFFDAISTPPAMAAIIKEGRTFGMGVTTSVSTMGAGLGMGLSPIIAGLIVDMTRVESAFYVAAGIGLICAAAFLFFTRRASKL